MPKIKLVNSQQAFFCLGCKCLHLVDSRWKYNYNAEKPTFKPELRFKVGPMPEGHVFAGKIFDCHAQIKDGIIQYLDGCSHDMKGAAIYLPDFDEMAKAHKTEMENRTPANLAIMEEVQRVKARILEINPEYPINRVMIQMIPPEVMATMPESEKYTAVLQNRLDKFQQELWMASDGAEGQIPPAYMEGLAIGLQRQAAVASEDASAAPGNFRGNPEK